jgi:serine/threonine protein kinase
VAVYRIDRFLGEGGFAYVYRARDTNLDIDVALKVLKPAFAYDEAFEENFRREAHRAAKFRHPNVIAIHYAGKDDDIVFFSMDLLEKGLKDLLKPGVTITEAAIIQVGIDVASALQFAHTYEGGIVHRDLKPDNILFDRHGNAVVTDFGIAEAASNYTAATGTTVYVGTPKYMSPEQARGQRVDHRSDLYSLGVTLFEMATAQPPFTGRDWFELGRKHIEEPPPLPRQMNPRLSAELERVILKCLQKTPADRYQSAGELSVDLRALKGESRHSVVLTVGAEGVRSSTPPTPAPSVQHVQQIQAREAQRQPHDLYSSTTQPPLRRRRSWVWLAVLALLGGGAAAYAYDVANLRTLSESQLPQLASIPFLGSGTVYATSLMYPSVEGGAAVDGRFEVSFSGAIDRGSATGANIMLIGPESRRIPAEVTLAPDRRRVIVRPRAPLAYETTYAMRIGAGLLSAQGTPILETARADKPGREWLFRTGRAPADADPPYLVESTPPNGARNVPVDQLITLMFNEMLDLNTVSTQSVRLFDAEGQSVEIDVLLSTEDQRSARIRAKEPLRPGRPYELQLASSILDRSGNRLIADTLSFTTGGSRGAVAGAKGKVNIRVTPGGARRLVKIVLDGDTLGHPPKLEQTVDAGVRHTLELIGGPEQTRRFLLLHQESFVIGAGQVENLDREVRGFGWITVTAQPTADVFIDGIFVGTTPVAGYTVFAGRHRLELHPASDDAAAYNTVDQEIEVPAFSPLRLVDVKLPRAN